MKRKVVIVLLAMLATTLLTMPALGAGPIKIVLNGFQLSSDVDPMTIKGRTVVPARLIAESLGADVQWDSEKKTATIIKNDSKITVEVNETTAEKNGETISLDTPAILKNGKLMLPLRFFAESFGAEVGWDGNAGEVKVNLAETKDEMSPEQYFTACSEAMSKTTSAKFTESIQMDLKTGTDPKTKMSMDFQGCNRLPQECYMKGKVKVASEVKQPDMKMEAYTDGKKTYTKKNSEKWKLTTTSQTPEVVKPLNGVGYNPQVILENIKTQGFILSFGNDVEKDGQGYIVINAKSDMSKIRPILDSVAKQAAKKSGTKDSGTIDTLQSMMKGMKMDLSYQVLINKKTKLPDIMKLNGNINMGIYDVKMKVNFTGNITMYGYDLPVQMPVIK
ncbi:MAG: copper amine oxidase N-terminal domain-containing protein [Chitinophagales bacterium]